MLSSSDICHILVFKTSRKSGQGSILTNFNENIYSLHMSRCVGKCKIIDALEESVEENKFDLREKK